MNRGYKKGKLKESKTLAKGYDGPMEPMKSTVSLDSDLLPEVKKWKVDETYTVTLKIKQTGIHKKYGSEDSFCADFEIESAEVAK